MIERALIGIAFLILLPMRHVHYVVDAAVLETQAVTVSDQLHVSKASLQQQDHPTTGDEAGTGKPANHSESNTEGHVLPGAPDPASERMLDWVRENGGEVDVAVRNVPGAGRATYATRVLKKGDVLTRIPVEMLWVQHDTSATEEVTAAELLADMARPNSPWKPFFDALPGPSEVFCSRQMPESYLPVIQDRTTEYGILVNQFNMKVLWWQYGDAHWRALGADLTPANLTHALCLLGTRMYYLEGANALLPVLDMANHVSSCPHSHNLEPCDPAAGLWQWQQKLPPQPLSPTAGSGVFWAISSGSDTAGQAVSGQCIVWRAEAPVEAGQEVCNSYGQHLQDMTLLQYGFLQEGPVTQELSMMDRPTPGPHHPYKPFTGNLSEVWIEVDRLVALLDALRDSDAAAAAVQPDASVDRDGRFLAMLREWRQQRKAAVAREIRRLHKEAGELMKGFQDWMVQHLEGGVSRDGSCAAAINGGQQQLCSRGTHG